MRVAVGVSLSKLHTSDVSCPVLGGDSVGVHCALCAGGGSGGSGNPMLATYTILCASYMYVSMAATETSCACGLYVIALLWSSLLHCMCSTNACLRILFNVYIDSPGI